MFTSDLDDLYEVVWELNPVVANWKHIGIALQLKSNALDTIEKHSSCDPRMCLSEMVKEWLKKNYNLKKYCDPTWQRLVEAVGDPAGGADTALAREIARRHKAEGGAAAVKVAKSCKSESEANTEVTDQGANSQGVYTFVTTCCLTVNTTCYHL